MADINLAYFDEQGFDMSPYTTSGSIAPVVGSSSFELRRGIGARLTGRGRFRRPVPPCAGQPKYDARRQALHGVDQVGEGAAEAVELPDDEYVARPERAHATVESRAVVADAGREVVVDVAGVDARSASRCRSSDWEPSAFETRA